MNVDLSQTHNNVYYKQCDITLNEKVKEMVANGEISLRGLKHVSALPIVKKEVKYSKRCKDKELVGKVKEVINQVSHSKKWLSEKATDNFGNSLYDKKGISADRIIKNLETRVNKFATLSINYEKEQKDLKDKINELNTTLDKVTQTEVDLKAFQKKMKNIKKTA